MCHLFGNKGQTNPTFIILYAMPRLPGTSVAFVLSWFLYGCTPAFVYRTKDECKLNIKYNV